MYGINKDAFDLAKSVEQVCIKKHSRFNPFNFGWKIKFIIHSDYMVKDMGTHKKYRIKNKNIFYYIVLPNTFDFKTFTVSYNPKMFPTTEGQAKQKTFIPKGNYFKSIRTLKEIGDNFATIDLNNKDKSNWMSVLIHEATHILKFNKSFCSTYFSGLNSNAKLFKNNSIQNYFYNEISWLHYILSTDESDATISELVYDVVMDKDVSKSNLTKRLVSNQDINYLFDKMSIYKSETCYEFDDKLSTEFVSIFTHLLKMRKYGMDISKFKKKRDMGLAYNTYADILEFFNKKPNKRLSYSYLDEENYKRTIFQMRMRMLILNTKLNKKYDKVVNMSDEKKEEIKKYLGI